MAERVFLSKAINACERDALSGLVVQSVDCVAIEYGHDSAGKVSNDTKRWQEWEEQE